ncbi:AGAP004620-PC-like protein [Anopheles sinensis]|uniref:AGAP004620-PC-like protein n=1 Tax=Anopheles sinensis TaxID=74873 RepID=A0A084W7W3_ANOSI|nr:AGAP004620-PC-like protein [Anopheles sinensis]
MGQRSGFSSSDLAKLNSMYGCKGTSGVSPSTGSTTGNATPQRPVRPSRPAGNNRPGNGAQVASAIVSFIGSIFGEEDSNTTSNSIEGARR